MVEWPLYTEQVILLQETKVAVPAAMVAEGGGGGDGVDRVVAE